MLEKTKNLKNNFTSYKWEKLKKIVEINENESKKISNNDSYNNNNRANGQNTNWNYENFYGFYGWIKCKNVICTSKVHQLFKYTKVILQIYLSNNDIAI